MNEVKKGRYEVVAQVIEMLAEEGYTMDDFALIVRELGEQKELVIPNDIPSDKKDKEKYQRVTEIIKEMGIPAHLKGYDYLRSAICEAAKDFTSNMIISILYNKVAEEFNTTWSKVERAMRHAIKVAWERGNADVLREYFGDKASNLSGKPANNEFIATIAELIRGDE